MNETIVVALGGNAILQPGQEGTIEEQLINVRGTCEHLIEMIKKGYRIVLTHGNGPQVGNILAQNEKCSDFIPPMSLDLCGSQTQGYMGYLIQQSMKNELKKHDIKKEVATIVTQVVVDSKDPAFNNPTKPIGTFYEFEKAQELMQQKSYPLKEDAESRWRRVVPSPDPKEIVEINVIKHLVDNDIIVIASGGGGIPVQVDDSGMIKGVEAVIDKDLAANCLAQQIKADELLILTDVEKVYINFKKPGEKALDEVSVYEMQKYQDEGHFMDGSMGPKVEAALRFVKSGGRKSIITSLDKAVSALYGKEGTQISSN